MLTNDHQGLVAITWGKFLRKCSRMPNAVKKCYVTSVYFRQSSDLDLLTSLLSIVLEDKSLLYSYLFDTQFQLPLLTSLLQFDMNLIHLLHDLYYMDMLVTSEIRRKLYHKCFSKLCTEGCKDHCMYCWHFHFELVCYPHWSNSLCYLSLFIAVLLLVMS